MTDPQTLETALSHHKAGRIAEAEALYNRILDDDPDNAEALHLMGVVAHQQDRPSAAIEYFGQAIDADSSVGKYHGNLGTVYASLKRFEEAEVHLERAMILDGDNVEIRNSLGAVQRELGHVEAAIATLGEAVRIDPRHGPAQSNLAVALLQAGRADEALAAASRAVEAEPADAGIKNTHAIALTANGRGEEAEAALLAAIELDPGHVESHRNLGVMLLDAGRLTEAADRFRRIIDIDQAGALGHANLAVALRRQGRIEDAVAHYRRAVELAPERALYHSNLLFILNGAPDVTRDELFAEHRRWNERHAAPFVGRIAPNDNDRDPDRKIRIGYVSPDFRSHPMGRYVAPLLANHDTRAIEVVCYANVRSPDDMTTRLRDLGHQWRDIAHLSDDRVAHMVREDGIDILIDLAGHMARNRLAVFARKPAPVQITWAGYPNTTGLDAMDFLIGDPTRTPDGEDALFSETVLRLPRTTVCFTPPEAPEPGAAPSAATGTVTFGSLNDPSKLTSEVIALWARVVGEVPGARLLLKYPGLDDPGTADHLLGRLAEAGVEPGRVELRGGSPVAEVLAAHGDIDIALDPFPYSGDMTTLESLWMGVPVVTMPGDRPISRMTAGHLKNIGLEELIATTAAGYIAIARGLAEDPARLSALRAGLRKRVAGSPLCDGAGFTRDFEAVLRDAWRRWCAQVQT